MLKDILSKSSNSKSINSIINYIHKDIGIPKYFYNSPAVIPKHISINFNLLNLLFIICYGYFNSHMQHTKLKGGGYGI